ncbi:MAG TPA: malectin domain-containing carbohydrate-binding protein [Tepidisphaeraceae bacterium]|jgi:hypothetical protein|nr:malectin domain-containing carbohydrate-binding protein [Tepidisphaeraceae bacterium]
MTAWNRKIPNGKYIVNLHFAETSDSVSASGQRLFSVVVQDKPIKNLDVFNESGGLRQAMIKSFPVKIGNGKLSILFRPSGKNVPEINGIEIIPTGDADNIKSRLASRGERGRSPGARVAAGSVVSLQDPLGNTWEADSGFDAGQVVDRGPIIIEHTDFPSLYRTEHFGMSSWRKPFPNGKYAVVLHFCETWDGITAASPRVFHVSVQGQPLRDLDILKESGGLRRPLVKTFHVVVTTGQVEILFERTSMNVPEINGIEITPER